MKQTNITKITLHYQKTGETSLNIIGIYDEYTAGGDGIVRFSIDGGRGFNAYTCDNIISDVGRFDHLFIHESCNPDVTKSIPTGGAKSSVTGYWDDKCNHIHII